MSRGYDVVIIGSGVIGLSIALELHKNGYKVSIVAKDLVEDVNSTGWASPWAGCNWHSFETDPNSRQLKWDVKTYKRLAGVAREEPELCQEIDFVDVYPTFTPQSVFPWSKDVKGYHLVTAQQGELPGKMSYGHKFRSYVLNAPLYTRHLAQRAISAKIPIIRKRLISLDQAYNLPEIGGVNLVVNASGLGSYSLLGVSDQKVYPARGQTVLVDAPGVKTCVMRADQFLQNSSVGAKGDAPPPPPPYIIPRPGSSTQVILGGTYEKNSTQTQPDMESAREILKQCYNLNPLLAGPTGTSWKDIKVVSVNVGLRPAREGGPRVELEKRQIGDGDGVNLVDSDLGEKGRKVGVVHAYGFGGVGYIASLGVAEEVVGLVRQYKGEQTREAKL